MKIAAIGLDLPVGKVKYLDPIVDGLVAKFAPKKVSPYFAEFLSEKPETADGFAVHRDRLLDLLIPDIEKLETRLERGCGPEEEALARSCLAWLEQEKPLCDAQFTAADEPLLKALALISRRPTLVCTEPAPEPNALITAMLEKAGLTFFYTAGKPEVHAWLVEKDADIVTCAGKIHTDLARGFIRAEIIRWDDLKDAHNQQEVRSKGLAPLVDRDYRIRHGDIVDVRFSV
jgi:hypothetical protein